MITASTRIIIYTNGPFTGYIACGFLPSNYRVSTCAMFDTLKEAETWCRGWMVQSWWEKLWRPSLGINMIQQPNAFPKVSQKSKI
jgi:hypothetical protein